MTGDIDNSQLYLEKLQQVLLVLAAVSGLEAILVNVWESETISLQIVQAIANYYQSVFEPTLSSRKEAALVSSNFKSNSGNSKQQSKSSESQPIPKAKPWFILRLLVNNNLDELKVDESIYISSNLEEVISQASAIVQSS